VHISLDARINHKVLEVNSTLVELVSEKL